MNRFNRVKPQTRASIIYRILLGIAAVALIVYFYPREKKYTYQFELNRPWRYGQLIATFDFPIYKSEELIQQEQDSILTQFQPYFQRENAPIQKKLAELQESYTEGALKEKLPNARYLQHLERTLQQIYNQGIISSSELYLYQPDSAASIMIVEGNSASSVPVRDLLSVKDAYEKLILSDTLHFDKQVLQQCNLHGYLTPNIIYDEAKSTALQNDLLNSISLTSGMVLNGTKIIDRGEIINERTFEILQSLFQESVKRSDTPMQQRLTSCGQSLFVAIMVTCFLLYLNLLRQNYFDSRQSILLLMAMLVLFPVITSLMVSYSALSVYIIPFAMVPIIVRIFMDSRTAYMTHAFMILICSIVLRYPYEFILI